MGRGGKGTAEPAAEVVGDLYVRLMQHVPPPKLLARTMWLSKRTMTSFRQQRPCLSILLLALFKLFSGGLFVWDIVSDILVIVSLFQAGESGLMGVAITIMLLPSTVFGYLFMIGFMKDKLDRQGFPPALYCLIGPFLLPFAIIYGALFSAGFDIASIVLPLGACLDQALFQRYPKLRKLLESVFESVPQAILQLYIVGAGILPDNIALVVLSIFTSILSAVFNVYLTYNESLAYEDVGFLQYTSMMAASMVEQGGAVIRHAGELRDGLKEEAVWGELDIKYEKDRTTARCIAVDGHPETQHLVSKGVRIREIDRLPPGTPMCVDTYPAWEGWWRAQVMGTDKLKRITMPGAFFSARAAHLFGQCIANAQYIDRVELSHCYLPAEGQIMLARGLACASSLRCFDTTLDFVAFVAGCSPSPSGGADPAAAAFWKSANTAVYRERVKENRANRGTLASVWAKITFADYREGSPDSIDVSAVVFPGTIPLGSVFVLAGCSALNLFNETLAISQVREAAFQATQSGDGAGGKGVQPSPPAPLVPGSPAVEVEEGGQAKGLQGTSERAQPIAYCGVTSPGIDLAPPRHRVLVVRFDPATCLRGGVCLDEYARVCAEAGMDGAFVHRAAWEACGRMVDGVLGWARLSATYHPTEACSARMDVWNVKTSLVGVFRHLASQRGPMAGSMGMVLTVSDRPNEGSNVVHVRVEVAPGALRQVAVAPGAPLPMQAPPAGEAKGPGQGQAPHAASAGQGLNPMLVTVGQARGGHPPSTFQGAGPVSGGAAPHPAYPGLPPHTLGGAAVSV